MVVLVIVFFVFFLFSEICMFLFCVEWVFGRWIR